MKHKRSAPPGATHELKTWPEFFEAIKRGAKTFELRKNDRGYNTGDTLVLKKWDPSGFGGRYVGPRGYDTPHANEADTITVLVTYVLSGFGLEAGYVAMGFSLTDELTEGQQ